MKTVTQDDMQRGEPRKTSYIRVYSDTIADLLALQAKEFANKGSKPTHAELVERALGLYKSDTKEGKGARKQ